MIGVLVSGGLDSLILLRLMEWEFGADAVRGVWYDLGHHAARRERMALPGGVIKRRLPWLDDASTLARLEPRGPGESFYLPGRNGLLLLAMLCQDGLDAVSFGCLFNEQREVDVDRNAEFRARLEALASFMMSRDVRVIAPLATKRWTKYDAILWALSHGVTRHELLSTYSCYEDAADDKVGCGNCRPCLRRFLLFNSLGIVEPAQDYEFNPLDGEAAETVARLLREDPDEVYGWMSDNPRWIHAALDLGAHGELADQLKKALPDLDELT